MVKNAHTVQSGWKELLKNYANQHISDERLKARLHGEGEAKLLIEEKLGQFSEEDIRLFLTTLNTDFRYDKERHDRFRAGFCSDKRG